MKQKYKFNIIDAIIIVIILTVIIFVGLKILNNDSKQNEINEFEFTILANQVPNFVIDYLKKESKASDSNTGDKFNNIIDFTIEESKVYNVNSKGEFVKVNVPDHSSVKLILTGFGEQTDYGVKIEKGVYGVGHTIVLKIGNAKLEGKISAIKKID